MSATKNSFTTPPKNILSPPPVNRKISFQTHHEKSLGQQSDSSNKNNNNNNSKNNNSDNNTSDTADGTCMMNNPGKDETGSMISQYGSDVEYVPIKFSELDMMDSLLESDLNEQKYEHASDVVEEDDYITKGDNHTVHTKNDMMHEMETLQEPADSVFTHNELGINNKQHDQNDTLHLDSNHTNYLKRSCSLSLEHDMVVGDNQEDDNKTNSSTNSNQEDAESIDSVDLNSSSSSSVVSPFTKVMNEMQQFKIISNQRTTNVTDAESPPSSPKSRVMSAYIENAKIQESPKTPIAAVSAALRRLGNNVSHMTRCSKLSPQSSFSFTNVNKTGETFENYQQNHFNPEKDHVCHDEDNNYNNNINFHDDDSRETSIRKSNKIWLSPRFEHLHQNRLHQETNVPIHDTSSQQSQCPSNSKSIQQPALLESQNHQVHSNHQQQRGLAKGVSTMHPSFSSRSATIKGITSCLSFDPESGKQPYGNMRISDSPPSSPVPSSWQNRRTKSCESSTNLDHLQKSPVNEYTGFDFRAHEKSSHAQTTKAISLSSKQFRKDIVKMGSCLQGHLSPRQDGAVYSSPLLTHSHHVMLESHHQSPKAGSSTTPIMYLQSPQVG
jgi:hypothetical protein